MAKKKNSSKLRGGSASVRSASMSRYSRKRSVKNKG